MLLIKNALPAGLQSCLKLPWHFLQVFTGAKSFEKNALLGNRYLNTKNLHVYRVSLAMRMVSMRRQRLLSLVTTEHAEAYERDGFIRVNNFLDAHGAIEKAIGKFASHRDCQGIDRTKTL